MYIYIYIYTYFSLPYTSYFLGIDITLVIHKIGIVSELSSLTLTYPLILYSLYLQCFSSIFILPILAVFSFH